MQRSKRVVLTTLMLGVGMVGVTACDSGGADAPPPPPTLPPTTTTTGPKVEQAQVDLVMVGSRNATIRGNLGTCTIPRFAAPTYDFVGAQYPDLGPAGSLSVIGPITVANGQTLPASIKIIINDVGFLNTGAGITVSPDKELVTINVEVAGGPGVTEDINTLPPDSSLRARLTGTIRCGSA